MTCVCLHDKTAIEPILRRNIYLHLYSIGDLDDFFWPYTSWYVTRDEGDVRAIALLYAGPTPTLLALTDEAGRMESF